MWPMSSEAEVELFLAGLVRGVFDGILAPREVAMNLPGLIIEATRVKGIPSMFDVPHYADLGGLASYGGPPEVVGRQAARLIDRLIQGQPPGQLPIELPLAFHFVINLEVADALGLAIPPMLLFQADRLIR